MTAAPTILVVEDNPMTRKLLRVTLGTAGYRVIEAEDARTALAAVEQSLPDLILQDLILPDMDGVELVDGCARWTASTSCRSGASGSSRLENRGRRSGIHRAARETDRAEPPHRGHPAYLPQRSEPTVLLAPDTGADRGRRSCSARWRIISRSVRSA
jgi:CheY-like chemotaxis protein